MTEYQGHKNWNHWNVSLWINGDEELYRLAQDCIKRSANKEEAAILFMGYVPTRTPDGAPYSVSSIRAAMVGM